MRLPDWPLERQAQPQALVDAILARHGGALLNLDKALPCAAEMTHRVDA